MLAGCQAYCRCSNGSELENMEFVSSRETRINPGASYALPMRMPEAKTSAPPRITCKADMKKLMRK